MFHPFLILIAVGAQAPKSPPPPAPTGTPAQTSQSPQQPATTSAAPAQAPGTPADAIAAASPPVQPAAVFAKPIAVAEHVRLAMTPNIDGKIDPEEWDPFTSIDGMDTYFQWEPEKLHFAAAHVPTGNDLIISVDVHGDSWLVGRDNLELRVHWNNNAPEVSERLLDCTPVTGPIWVDADNYKAVTTVAGSVDEKGRNVEITVGDPATNLMPTKPNTTIGLRFDVLPEATPPPDPLLPRVTTPVTLQYQRGEDIPAGLTWRPEIPQRSVVPGERSKIRLTFSGNDDLGLKRVEMRSEGEAQNWTDSSGVPFPNFDKKGRAFVDYKTNVTKDAELGYRILKATVTDAQGKSSVLETSYEIAPLVTFDFHEKPVASSSEPQTVKFSAYIRSHTMRRVDGVFRVQAPEGWKVKSGDDTQFLIYDSRGSKRQVFELVVPSGYKGMAPIKLIADFAGSHAEQTEYVVVQ